MPLLHMVNRIFENEAMPRFIASRVAGAYVVSWSDRTITDLRSGKALTFYAAVLSGGAPDCYTWQRAS